MPRRSREEEEEFTRNVRPRYPRRSTALPRYESELQNVDGNLHMVALRPVFSGGENASELETRRLIANSLKLQILRGVRASGIRGPRRDLERRIRGVLTARNMEGPDRSVGRSIILKDLDEQKIEDMFSLITQSNDQLEIYQVQWVFILPPDFFRQGASAIVKKPKWWKGNAQGWEKHEDEFGVINCAAVALTLCTNGIDRPYRKYCTRPKQLLKDARKLQKEMGWGEYVSLPELQDFIVKYPKFRLTVIMSEKCSSFHTYEGKEFKPCKESLLGSQPSEYYIYVYFDLHQKHYCDVRHPQEFYNNREATNNLRFCHHCTTRFNRGSKHKCEQVEWHPTKPKTPCKKCNLIGCTKCRFITCYNCGCLYERGDTNGEQHRCMLLDFSKEDTGYNINENDGKKPALWVYDLEAEVIETEEEVSFKELDEEGYYPFSDEEIDDSVIFIEKINQQVANYCYALNVFTGETLEYFGEDCLDNFLTYILNYNLGHNIMLAHNGSGYDTRLIYESLLKRQSNIILSPTMRGTKFLELRVNRKLYFRDSRNHMNGSLANLAKDYQTETMKGYFPHLFNCKQNYSYTGCIPPKDYFDLSHFKTDSDILEFHKWYDAYEGEWNFMDQLKLYCINDVKVLGSVVLQYHDIYYEKFKQSPWKTMTSSSYFHKLSKQRVTLDLELPDKKDPDYASHINEKYKNSWTVLQPPEYAAAKQALRGGRTGIGRILCELSEDQKARGCQIKYVDVVSLYPYQQVAHDFPIGPPKIHVFDLEFAPCYYHANTFSVECKCDDSHRYHTQTNYVGKLLDIEFHNEEWDEKLILSKHGFVMATVQPPMMLHPLLVRYDEEELKCNATCELIEKGCFTSVEFHEALKAGYKIIKLHRFDEYKMAPPLWEDFVKEMYIFKLVNSATAPEGEKRQKMIQEYEDNFEMGDMIAKTFEPNIWGKNPAKKAAAKTGLNAGWGKHAQRMILSQAAYVDWKDPTMRSMGDNLFLNVQNDSYSLQGGLKVGDERYLYQFKKDGRQVKHDFSNCYLPAACFVPAYGRLQLWEQLNKLGDRVLMYDTDSVVYIYDPELYNVPQSKLWGGWEEEGISEKGITGFVGLGPKSYAMRCADGVSHTVKLKGISQKRATDKILNYDSLRQLVQANIELREKQSMQIPQTVFEYRMTKGIFTMKLLKLLSFDLKEQKGMVGKNYFMYPKGYVGKDFEPI